LPEPHHPTKEQDDLTDQENKLYIRQVAVFAACTACSDHEIGRVIQAIDAMGTMVGQV